MRREGDLRCLGTSWNELFNGLGSLDYVINTTTTKKKKKLVHRVMLNAGINNTFSSLKGCYYHTVFMQALDHLCALGASAWYLQS